MVQVLIQASEGDWNVSTFFICEPSSFHCHLQWLSTLDIDLPLELCLFLSTDMALSAFSHPAHLKRQRKNITGFKSYMKNSFKIKLMLFVKLL